MCFPVETDVIIVPPATCCSPCRTAFLNDFRAAPLPPDLSDFFRTALANSVGVNMFCDKITYAQLKCMDCFFNWKLIAKLCKQKTRTKLQIMV